MHSHQFRTVRKSGLDLDVVDHLRNTFHTLLGRYDMRAGLHQVGDRPAVARALDDEVGD